MSITDVAFYVLSAFAVWTGWRVFRADSMIRATFALMLSFSAVGGIILLLSGPYIGVATVFMMAVEMMVMGLFMVMFMMNPAGLNPMQMVHQHRLSVAIGAGVFVATSAAVLLTVLPDNPVAPGQDDVRRLGLELLGDSMLTFETAGVTLLATMLGAVILSSRRGRYGLCDQGSTPPGLEPGGMPAGRVATSGGGHGGHGGHGGGHGGEEHGGGHGGHEGHGGDDEHKGHGGGDTGMPEAARQAGDAAHAAHEGHEGHEGHAGHEGHSNADKAAAGAHDEPRAHRGHGKDHNHNHGAADDPKASKPGGQQRRRAAGSKAGPAKRKPKPRR